MKPVPFAYHAPADLAEAISLLSNLSNPRLLAGGQSLVPMLNFRIAAPDNVIDLNNIDALREITLRDGQLCIGSMATQRVLERSALVRRHCPLLFEAVGHIGHQQTRNRGTLGGSLCHLDPAAELPVVAAALDPVLVAIGPQGERRLRFAAFPAGYLTNALRPGEVLARVDVPILPEGGRVAFEEVARRPADFAIVAVAVQLIVRHDNTVGDVRIAIGGLAAAPIRLTTAESALDGRRLTDAAIAEARRLAAATPADGDALNPSDYRQHLAGVLTSRALERLTEARSAHA